MLVGASANMYYVPAGSANAGHGFFPAGAAGGVVPGQAPPLRVMLVQQIEYYFRYVSKKPLCLIFLQFLLFVCGPVDAVNFWF